LLRSGSSFRALSEEIQEAPEAHARAAAASRERLLILKGHTSRNVGAHGALTFVGGEYLPTGL